MKILGIDTTGQTAGAALLDGDRLLAEFSLNYKLTHSQTILPMIAELLERTETAREDIGFIACSVPALLRVCVSVRQPQRELLSRLVGLSFRFPH